MSRFPFGWVGAVGRFGSTVCSIVFASSVGVGLAACSTSSSIKPELLSLPVWKGTRYPTAAFVVSCSLSHEARVDPLKFPGQRAASHMHSFYGNRSTSEAAGDAVVQKMLGADTSCADRGDTAAYWTPSPAGDTMRAYYDAGAARPEAIVAYPLGMKGIAGDPAFTEPGVDVVGFRCGSVSDGPDGSGWNAWPPGSCAKGVPIVRYSFGQCADESGQELVACKSSQRATFSRLRLLFEFRGLARHGGTVVGAHADFWNVWAPTKLARLVAVCNRGERGSNLELKECGLPGGQ